MKTLPHVMFSGLLACGALVAQSPIQAVPLFAKIPGLQDPEAATHQAIDRGVPVALNNSLLYAGRVGDLLQFPAFDGQSFDLRLEERTEIEAVPGAFEWRISVPGNPNAQGAIVVVGDKVASWLAPADGRFSTLAIQPTLQNMHCLREVRAKPGYCGCDGNLHAPHHPTVGLDNGPRAMHSDVPCSDATNEISVLCVYEGIFDRLFGGNAVRSIILAGLSQSTQAMQTSSVNTTFVATSIRGVNYVGQGVEMSVSLTRLASDSDGIMDEVHTWRRDEGADLVSLMVGNHSSHGTTLGIAYAPTTTSQFQPGSGFSVNELNSVLDLTMAHEFGHNFGCFHDRDNASGTPFRPYAYGYRTRYFNNIFDQRWAYTVMAYDPPCGAAVCTLNQAIAFSSPNVYISTNRGNIYVGDADNNNARAIRESLQWVANYSLRLDGPPNITQHPSARNVCAGAQADPVMLTVTADNTCSYEWFKFRAGWQPTGQTGASLLLSNPQPSDSGDYRCQVTNVEGSLNSLSARLTVSAPAVITQQPTDRSVPVGPQTDPNVLSVTATGASIYQWMKQASDGSFQPISGQTGSTLWISNARCEDSGVYRCRAFGGCGPVDSDSARLTVGQAGRVESYGFGCASESGSVVADFYEQFGRGFFMDLTNQAFRFTPGPGGWSMRPCSSCFDGAFANRLSSGDDVLRRGLPLGFSFPLPAGGSTTQIDVDSNGWVGLVSGQFANSQYLEDPNRLASDPARIAVFWDDLNPALNGGLYFDAYADRALVTWSEVPEFGGVGRNNFQLQLFPNGEFVLAFGAMTAGDGLVGHSSGGVPFVERTDLTNVGGQRIALRATSSAPTVNEAITLQANAPDEAVNAVVDLGFLRQSIDLSVVGMPGCRLLTTQDDSLPATLANGMVEVSLTVPNDLNLVGFTVHTQAVLLAPGANPLGVLTSNGLSLTVGSCR